MCPTGARPEASWATSSALVGHRPSARTNLQKRADEAWSAAKLDRITLHECRHTFASLMIAAGVNAKSPQEFMGHASITIKLDRYGHPMPAQGPRPPLAVRT